MITYKTTNSGIEIRDAYAGTEILLGIHYESYGITPEIATAYLESLIKHITAVREAGEQLGVDSYQLQGHDSSKWSLLEFPYYARNFHGDKADPDGFARAWLHHIHENEHHSEHWRFPGDFCPKGSNAIKGCLPMPRRYLMENIADWMGASKGYTGSFDLTDWLSKNMSRMFYHPETAVVLRQELDLLGYADVVYSHKWGSEIQ